MIKELSIGAAFVSAVLLTGCGGSSSSSSTPKYVTLQDLEYKTLTVEEYWHKATDDTKNKTNSTMVFKEKYTEGGFLIDERSSTTGARLCTVLDQGEYKYMCMTFFFQENTETIESSAMHIFNIASDNKITGNFAYSSTANTEQLAQSVSTRESSHAWITGTASTTASSKVTSKLTNTLNKEQLSLSKINVKSTNKLTQNNEYLNAILNDMKSEVLSK